ncbi:MAG: hypothetical protein IPG99_15035 [Ignavibacteria bacterium]|nr:hypothetical protein [Ignavibacteria bacterium]
MHYRISIEKLFLLLIIAVIVSENTVKKSLWRRWNDLVQKNGRRESASYFILRNGCKYLAKDIYYKTP